MRCVVYKQRSLCGTIAHGCDFRLAGCSRSSTLSPLNSSAVKASYIIAAQHQNQEMDLSTIQLAILQALFYSIVTSCSMNSAWCLSSCCDPNLVMKNPRPQKSPTNRANDQFPLTEVKVQWICADTIAQSSSQAGKPAPWRDLAGGDPSTGWESCKGKWSPSSPPCWSGDTGYVLFAFQMQIICSIPPIRSACCLWDWDNGKSVWQVSQPL